MTDELIGRQIENYRIDALLGEGGMGAVYRAYDLNLARSVALKVMNRQLARNKEFQLRFLQEARAAAGLNEHPSIVPIYYFGEKQGLLFMVMGLVTGGSLSAHIQQMQKSGEVVQLKEILALLAQVADALGYAHRKGVVHRDIKPSNVLVQRLETPDREGDPPLRAIVTDFGLAKLQEGGLETRTGEVMGTYGYMSPEQCLQKPLDGRSDIYSLGVMTYQLTTGRLPFDIQSPTDAVLKHLNETPPPPRSVWPSLPVKVEAIIQKAIAKKPEERYQKAEVMAEDLRDAARKLTEADVTQFVGQRTMLSIVTHLQSVALNQEPSRMGFDLPPSDSEDQLVVAQKDHTPRAVPLNKTQLTIGRSSENDIVLDHADVSRQHARLERGTKGWQIVDLKSTNGTFLDDAPLLAGIPEAFPSGKALRIGPYFFHWRAGTSPVAPAQPLTKTALRTQSSTGTIGVTAQPNAVETQPGSRAEVQVELFNQGLVVDHFKLRLADLPPSWVSIPQPMAELMPGKTAMLPVVIQPPQDSSAKAGDYAFRIIVESQAVPTEQVTVPAQLKVKPFEGFSITLRPTRLPNKGSSQLSIHNEGNDQATYSLTAHDPGNEVQFTGEQARIRVTAGETVVKQISAQSRKRSWIGSARLVPFEVQVKPAAGTAKSAAGQVVVRPVFPTWVLPVMGLLLVACLVLGGLGYNLRNQNNQKATQAAQTSTAVVIAGENVMHNNQTQESQQTASAVFAASQTAAAGSTAQALTAVAQGDDDGDGVSNQKELALGTDPKNPDIDGDGLTDGQEVNQYGTDPMKKDSDGDNLIDGDEVNKYQSNPTNPDTDGDGVLDGVEISLGTDPLLPPTATPEPTDTPTATATPSPSPTKTQTLTSPPPPPVRTLVLRTLVVLPVSILACTDTGTGGDAADSRGIRFTVENRYKYIEVRLAGAQAGSYSVHAELRRSTGFTGNADYVSAVVTIDLPAVTAGTPYKVVRFTFDTVPVSGSETFTYKILIDSAPSNLYLETYGIGHYPCSGVEETNENNVANPTVRGDPAGFQVFGWR